MASLIREQNGTDIYHKMYQSAGSEASNIQQGIQQDTIIRNSMLSSHDSPVLSQRNRQRCEPKRRTGSRLHDKPKSLSRMMRLRLSEITRLGLRLSGIPSLTLIVMIILLSHGISVAETRSIRETCSPPLQENSCINSCDRQIYYYFSPTTEKCELCKYCAAGKQPDHKFPCEAQAEKTEVQCVSCNVTHTFSSKNDQNHCRPCNECGVLNKVIAEECTATSDRVCGDCKPGYFGQAIDEELYCISCQNARSKKDKEKCLVTTMKPTTQPSTTTEQITTAVKHTPLKESGKEPEIDKDVNERRGVIHPTSIQLAIVGGIFVILISLICAGVYTINSWRSRRSLTDSKRSSDVSYTKAAMKENHDFNSEDHSMGPVPSVGILDKNGSASTSTILMDNTENEKIFSNAAQIESKPAHRMERQRSPEEKNENAATNSSNLPNSSVSSTDSPSSAGNQSTKDCRPQAAENKNPNLPQIHITDNQRHDLNKVSQYSPNVGFTLNISDISSGDESDRGSTARDPILPQKQPRRKQSVGSLVVPTGKKPSTRIRRRSSCGGAIGPLRTIGGLFSSGSSREFIPPDSGNEFHSSVDNDCVSSVTGAHSLHSYSAPTEQYKRKPLTRQLSHDNTAMDTRSHNGEFSDEICQKGPVTQPLQSDEPVLYRNSYQLLPQYEEPIPPIIPEKFHNEECGNNPAQMTAQATPRQQAIPNNRLHPDVNPSTNPPSSRQQAILNGRLHHPEVNPATNHPSSRQQAIPNVRLQHDDGHSPTNPPSYASAHLTAPVVHNIYHFPPGDHHNIVINGNNNNLIQQGSPVGATAGASNLIPDPQLMPRTPEPVVCTDDELVKCEFEGST